MQPCFDKLSKYVEKYGMIEKYVKTCCNVIKYV